MNTANIFDMLSEIFHQWLHHPYFLLFLDVLGEALLDSLKLLPFLLIVYLAVGWLEYRLGDTLGERLRRAGGAGPALGALCGCIPQCGFSVMGSALYARGLITLGTLLAVFIATSDEAMPVILSHPDRFFWVLPLVGTKVLLALVVGFAVDAITHRLRAVPAPPEPVPAPVHGNGEEHAHGHAHGHEHAHAHAHLPETAALVDEVQREHGCCDHHIAGECPVPGRTRLHALLWHPLRHTLRVLLYIFLVILAMGLLIETFGAARISAFLQGHALLQPVVAALFGLIPNCAASVIITQLFLSGDLTFGATISGLSTGAGVGLLVLLRENPNRRNTAVIVGLLLGISILVGMLLQFFLPWVKAG